MLSVSCRNVVAGQMVLYDHLISAESVTVSWPWSGCWDPGLEVQVLANVNGGLITEAQTVLMKTMSE